MDPSRSSGGPSCRSTSPLGTRSGECLSLAPSRAWVRFPPSPPHASVVSTASTRPLYGRGAGSTPAGGSVVGRPKLRGPEHCPAKAEDAGSSPAGRAHADVAQTAKRRVASPERPVRLGSSALTKAPGVTESTASSNLAGPGSTPGGPARSTVAGRSGSVISGERRKPAVRLRTRPHATTATHICCGPDGSGYRLRIDRSRVRVPPGAFRAPVAQWVEQFRASNTTAA